MLKPYRLLVINSESFSKNKKQHLDWYDSFNGYIVNGFPNNYEVKKFLSGLTHVFVCENPLNFFLFTQAKRDGVKTYVQSNYEFCDNLKNHSLPLPDKFLMPSHWKLEEMRQRFGEDIVVYLPPPIDPMEYKEARDTNLQRSAEKLRILHVVGTLASYDRNGTLDLLRALGYTTTDFELVVHSQHELPKDYIVEDPRISYHIGSVENSRDLYKGFDLMVLPRRYGGLCLPMWEALMSAIPVVMTNMSPNDSYLPSEWLVTAVKSDQFMARVMIDVYSSNIREIAKKIDWFAESYPKDSRTQAFEIAYNNVSPSVLSESYEKLW